MMEFILDLLVQSFGKVWVTFLHNWPFLLVSVLISVGLKLYINPQKVSSFITRYRRVGIVGATAVAVTTPFCSCGTTAVILGMIASTIPWAPIVAFMVASPLTSPEELIYSAGLFGWPFAIAFFVSSILLGLLGGILAEFIESRGWLANQARFALQTDGNSRITASKKPLQDDQGQSCTCEPVLQPSYQSIQVSTSRLPQPVLVSVQELAPALCCAQVAAVPVAACSCASTPVVTTPAPEQSKCGQTSQTSVSPVSENEIQKIGPGKPKVTARQWMEEIYQTGGKLLLMFMGFAFIGYILNGLIPSAWVAAIFGKGNIYSVPLAATLGLPLYINTEGSLPLVRALIEGGMSQGSALAFLITGAGTSIGAIAGALTIARWRVIALVVGTLWVGAVGIGYTYNFLLDAHLF